MPLHADLHRHLGGSIVPRIFWRFLQRTGHELGRQFQEYEQFEAFVTRPRASLTEFLELHSMVERVQRIDTLPYFVSKLVRGASVFEGIVYLELRSTPWFRTDPDLDFDARVAQMRDIVRVIGESGRNHPYPLRMRQILCMHSRLPVEVNRAIIALAAAEPDLVCGVDLAGPDTLYAARLDEHIESFQIARRLGLKTTCHMFETANGLFPELLPWVDRIGHGIHIALSRPDLLPAIAERGQCLEVCPTSYLKTGILPDLDSLRAVFDRTAEHGVDTVICTDNPGLHNVRLPFEFENLLTLDVIDFATLDRCEEAAFRHAFAWPHAEPPQLMVHRIARPEGTGAAPAGLASN